MFVLQDYGYRVCSIKATNLPWPCLAILSSPTRNGSLRTQLGKDPYQADGGYRVRPAWRARRTIRCIGKEKILQSVTRELHLASSECAQRYPDAYFTFGDVVLYVPASSPGLPKLSTSWSITLMELVRYKKWLHCFA